MNISIFGLGYVGCVTAACLAQKGHTVIGVDVNPVKVDLVNSGRSPIVEPGLQELLSEVVQVGRLRATMNASEAVLASELSLVCVGTPANADGSQNLAYLRRVCHDIGAALSRKDANHLVAIRSTVFPGTTENVLVPILQAASGKQVGQGLDVAVNPEFLREGCSLRDFYDPPFIIIGELHIGNAALLVEMYQMTSATVFKTNIRTAEMIKCTCNAFHALKVAFANEIGSLCREQEINSFELMDIFVADTQLNLSPAYLKPGLAFGGSCLPKDVQALVYQAAQSRLSLPLLENILPSNQAQIARSIALVNEMGKKNIGVIGLSFKGGTDDLRDSTAVKMVRAWIDRGLNVQVHDEAVNAALLLGANREFMERTLPELPSILKGSLETVIASSDVIVLTQSLNPDWQVLARLIRDEQVLVDLVGQNELQTLSRGRYVGPCW
jgi:GDP-mannose 6-dehydrogenase